MSWRKEVEELELRHKFADELGGKEAVARYNERGSLTIRQRIDEIADKESFREIGKLAGKAT